ncbi:MAG: hypothetical protein KF883_07850 [Thermomicrobiales bacterium]|nr:hypothetical protein [Thermomicrobiales bacterium]
MPASSLLQPANEDDLFSFDDADSDFESGLELTCPGCDTRLDDDPAFARYRICPGCARHFWMPARERLELVVDEGTFHETNAELVSVDPLLFRDATERPPAGADSSSYPFSEALITGWARIGGKEVQIAVIDLGMIGEDIGAVAGEKLVLAIEEAAARRRPLVAVCSGGAGRAGASMLSLVQAARLANSIARLQRVGLPFIALISHPTAGTLYSGFACHANLLFAEPGSQIGLSGPPGPTGNTSSTAEAAVASGYLDGVIDRRDLREHLVTLLDILVSRTVPRMAAQMEAASVSTLSAAQEASLALHPDRPTSSDYIARLMPGFVELHGDRAGCECSAVRIGLGQLDGVSIAVIAIDRSSDVDAADTAASFRKATRLMRLALILELPVLTLIDSFGLTDGGGSVSAGAAVALYYRTVTTIPVPTVAVIVGAASGVQAMCASVADRTLMLEHAVFIPAGPETGAGGSAAHLRTSGAAQHLSSRECRRLGVVDSIVPEPGDGAHIDPQGTAQQIRLAATFAFGELAAHGPRRLQDERSRKLRNLGLAGPGGPDEVRQEIAHLQDLQRSVGRSIDDIRDRLETHHLGLPSLPQRPPMPAMPHLPPGVVPNLPSLRKPTLRRPEIGDLAGRLATTRREFSEKVSDVRSNFSESILHSDEDDSPSDMP